RAAVESVDRRPGRLATAHVDGPEPTSVASRDGDQIPVEGRVVEVVEADRGRNLDERGAACDPVTLERRPNLADPDVEMLRLAAEHRRDERARLRGGNRPGGLELG